MGGFGVKEEIVELVLVFMCRCRCVRLPVVSGMNRWFFLCPFVEMLEQKGTGLG